MTPDSPEPGLLKGLPLRAGRAAVLVGGRGAVIRAFGLLGTLVFVRLLDPEDFGLLALGMVLVGIGTTFADAGLGPGLIRRAEPPSSAELSSVLGFSLLVAAMLSLGAAAAAGLIGGNAVVVALMAASVPFAVLRLPALIQCERQLEYRPLVVAEIGEAVVYNLLGLALILLGMGVAGLAAATVVRSLVGSLLAVRVSRITMPAPSLRWQSLRPLLGFGLKFQGVAWVGVLRDQGINVGVALIAGSSALGIWSLAFRVMSVPYLLFEALWRVSFPAIARLLEGGGDARPTIERMTAVSALICTFPLALLSASGTALIPVLFGSEWRDAASVIPPAAAGLAIAGPLSVACAGYLFATNRAGVVLRGAVMHTLVWFVIAFGLLDAIGFAALGIGWCASALVEGTVLGTSTAAATGARLVKAVYRPVLIGALAAGAGAAVASPSIQGALLSVAISAATYLGLAIWLERPNIRRVVGLIRTPPPS